MKNFFSLPQATLLATAPLLATAHMFLEKPTPFPGGDNSPLLGTGDNFPCRVTNPSQYTASTRNQWPVGSQQPLEFKGTAVHGGGSCQVSVTTDKAPTKTSKWRVIMSIEGGCPASVEGNLKPDERLNNFTMTVPPELPNGDLTMAWTWFNHLGNREFYMVCAPITVSGGAKDTAEFDKLPEMARANVKGIGADDCTAPHGNDYSFANPGKNVVRMGLPQNKLVPLCGGKAEGGNSSPGGQPANSGAPSPAPGAPSPAPANPGASSQAPNPSGSAPTSQTPAKTGSPSSPAGAGGVVTSTIRTIVTITASSGAPGPSNAPSPAPPAPKPDTPASAPISTPSQAPAAGTGSGTCSTDGAVVCNGPSEFAICNFGKAAWQAVAQGTTCQDGKIVRRHVAPLRRHGREWI